LGGDRRRSIRGPAEEVADPDDSKTPEWKVF
jgi:hypothetical protein